MSAFREVVGHREVQERLSAAIEKNTVSHAYLFEGISGVGKRTTAREFIKALLCTEPQAQHQACGRCVSCRTLDSGNHPDVQWIRRGTKSSIGIGEIRDRLLHDISIQPYQSAYKVYVIEEADLMTTEAQNALLKTLEEPPSYALILLLASNSQKFLPTVLSRVITIHFEPLEAEVIAKELVRRLSVSEEKAALIAALARGSLGVALELTSSEAFAALRDELSSHLETLHRDKPSQVLAMADFFNRYKDQQETVFSLMQIWYRDLLMLKLTENEDTVMTRDKILVLRQLSGEYSMEEALNAFSNIQNIQDAIRQGAQYAFAIDCLLARMIL